MRRISNGSFKTYDPIAEPLVIESNRLGTIILEPREKLRIRRENTQWFFRQRFSDGPQLMISLDKTRPDKYYFWVESSRGSKKWYMEGFDPTWIGPDGKWLSPEYEYLGREVVMHKNGLLQN